MKGKETEVKPGGKTIALADNELRELRKLSFAIHGLLELLEAGDGIDINTLEIASVLAPIDSQLSETLYGLEQRFEKGGVE